MAQCDAFTRVVRSRRRRRHDDRNGECEGARRRSSHASFRRASLIASLKTPLGRIMSETMSKHQRDDDHGVLVT